MVQPLRERRRRFYAFTRETLFSREAASMPDMALSVLMMPLPFRGHAAAADADFLLSLEAFATLALLPC